ncbi:MAG: gliding motility-associated C-terminal domain-containing protein, partial [Bacteroidota bacterium]
SLPDNVSRQDDLDGGSYSVTVTDNNGCSLVIPNIMVGEPAELLVGGTPIKIGENGAGGVNVVIQGGSGPFTYSWTGEGDYTSDREDIDDVTVPGTYCLTVTDNNGCDKVQCFAVIEDISYDIEVANGCTGEDNGAISLDVTGATGDYDYEWTRNGEAFANTRDIDNLAPGDYTVTITSGPCVSTATISIEPEDIRAPANVTPSTTGNNGSITITPSGGNPPFSYEWGEGNTDQNRTGLATGEFCVTITDESRCEKEFCYVVSTDNIFFGNNSTRPASCPDATDGVLRLLINNGVAPFTIQVEPAGVQATADTSIVEIGVPPGTFNVTVTDAQNGQIETELTVDGPAPIVATANLTSDTEDTGCSGMISLDLAGGTGPYTVAWSNAAAGPTISQLCAGTYSATVTDDNGCSAETETFTISRIDEELDSITLVACEDGMNGEIFVTVNGGAEPYTYSWTRTGETDELSTEEDITGIGAGDFTLTITDATGATLVKNYTVGNTAGFSVSAAVTTNYGGFGASCSDASDAQLQATISGQGDFFYEWMREDATVAGTNAVIDNQPPGAYTLIVSDGTGCEIVVPVTVTAPPSIVQEETITRISCGSTDDGVISVTPSGGVGGFEFDWSTGSTAAQIQGLGTGEYSLSVTDGNGCVNVRTYALAAPEDLAITFEATPADDGCNGTISILPLGGSGNFIYNWPQLPNQGNEALAEDLCPGEYTLEVTDDNGCQTVTMTATVLDRRLPCLSAREVLTPNGDGLNETLVIFCSGDDVAAENVLEVYNRWGQLVYEAEDYDCSEDEGLTCFDGRTNDGAALPAGPYYYVFEFTTAMGDRMQQRGSFTILRD